MTITEYGLECVEKALANAIEAEQDAREELDKASERVDALREAVECDHPEDQLENVGAFILSITRCKKCGFEWED